MQSTIREQGSYTIITLSGEIDFHSSPQVRKDMLKSLDQDRNLLVDLSEVSYIDSSTIASLVESLQHAKGRKLDAPGKIVVHRVGELEVGAHR